MECHSRFFRRKGFFFARRTPREGSKVFWELDLNSCACGGRDARLDGGVVVSRVFETPLFRFVALVHRRGSPREF